MLTRHNGKHDQGGILKSKWLRATDSIRLAGMEKATVRTALIIILLCATWSRLHHLDTQSFWNDEGNSARLSERSIPKIIEGTASDIHPPLYYFVLRGWRELAGESEFALRVVSAFSGIWVVALSYRFGRLTTPSHPIPILLATLFVALNPGLIWYSQEARMYMLLPLWAMASTVLLLIRIRHKTRHVWIGYVLCMTAGLYTHYFFPIMIGVHGLIALVSAQAGRKHKHILWQWGAAVLTALLLYAPWIPFMLNGMGGNRGEAQSLPDFLIAGGQFQFSGFGGQLDNMTLLLLISLITIGFIEIIQRDEKWTQWGAALFGLLLLPMIALAMLNATDPEFNKFLLLSVPPLMLLVAWGIEGVWQMQFGRIMAKVIAVGATILILSHSTRATHQQWHDPELARDDYRGMAATIAQEARPNTAIILNAPNQWEVFTYYHKTGAPVYPLPRSQDEAAVLAELHAIQAIHDHIYALYWGDQQQDPQHWVENWLDKTAFKTSEEWVGRVRFVQYLFPAESENITPSERRFDMLFGEMIRLNRVELAADQVRPNDIIQIALEWEAVGAVDGRYKQFVHLVNRDHQLVAQQDREPVPMTADWSVGEMHTVNVGLTADVEPGVYQLFVGLYPIADPMHRLQLADGRDMLEIGTIIVIK